MDVIDDAAEALFLPSACSKPSCCLFAPVPVLFPGFIHCYIIEVTKMGTSGRLAFDDGCRFRELNDARRSFW